MVLMILLGLVDMIIAVLFFIHNSFDKLGTWFPNSIIFWCAIILLIKGIFFLVFLDFASIVDIVCGAIILLSVYIHIYWLLAFVVVVFLIQKALLSIVR